MNRLGHPLSDESICGGISLKWLGGVCRMDESRHFAWLRPVLWRHVCGNLLSLLLSLTLVHGMIASPLLVNCLPSDGRSLVELVGQDPCHHAAGLADGDTNDRSAKDDLAPGGPTDPCIDLILDSVGTYQHGVVFQFPMTSGADSHAASALVPWFVQHLMDFGGLCRPARDSLTCCRRNPHVFSSLRI